MTPNNLRPALYDHKQARDSCGFGMAVNLHNRPSHELLRLAIDALIRLDHRGGVNMDGTSDGSGLLVQKPDTFLRSCASRDLGQELPEVYAVGMVFLSRDATRAAQARKILENALEAQGLAALGWRSVPTDEHACADLGRLCMPAIEQIFVGANAHRGARLGALLYAARKAAEQLLADDPDFYVCSLAEHVLCYKGLSRPDRLQALYPDLGDADFQTSICVFHVRYSTNTLPHWSMAHPFRMLAHNGEINTITGNRNWSMARRYSHLSKLLPDPEKIVPIVNMHGSDSSSLDNMLDFLVSGGLDPVSAIRTLIPPAFEKHPLVSDEVRAFYAYQAMHMESWDGPAGIVMTEGRRAMCVMDRNGLRPARYCLSKQGYLMVASEAGVWDCPAADISAKGRIGPGDILVADTATAKLQFTKDVEESLVRQRPYARWLKQYTKTLDVAPDSYAKVRSPAATDISEGDLQYCRKIFQCSPDECQHVLTPLAYGGQEATGSMGDDVPIVALSSHIRPLYDMCRQRFAQVTNPAIDSLRESAVMSLEAHLGREHNIFSQNPENALNVKLLSPVLSPADFAALEALKGDFQPATIDCSFNPIKDKTHANSSAVEGGAESLEDALEWIVHEAAQQARSGRIVLILSDMNILNGRGRLPIPSILAIAATHQHLMEQGLRAGVNLVQLSGSARDSHQIATLFGFGATAVYPWMSYAMTESLCTNGFEGAPKPRQGQQNYRKGIEKGLLKIMSKMGISTLASYRGAALFEPLGFDKEVMRRCFSSSQSRIGGISFKDIESDLIRLAAQAEDASKPVMHEGVLKYTHAGEQHAFHPGIVYAIHKAVRSGKQEDYKHYAEQVDGREALALRDLLHLRTDKAQSISIDAVEPAEKILQRFDSAGMSLGALSPEAHETLAIAMNRLGGRSNSGEGGEDPDRYEDDRCSRIKQVASGRFGVTPHYLSSAEVIQIKIAQGAKPGEGGQLPGHKVNALIAKLRCCSPGVSLISPPPHHDIYSIEDLSQLIYDLKEVNDTALVSVKLVASPGIGTIATGVAKAGADLITVSGHDGGTGASPLSSIRYAGSPWELGLSEVHQALRMNGLRGTVRVQVDGGLKTGLDVIKGAILGAESFGFGTAPMIAMGCKYLRACHLNNCATGIATGNEILREKHFVGDAQAVMNFFNFIADDVRSHLADLGTHTLSDIIGRLDLLQVDTKLKGRRAKIDFSAILSTGSADEQEAQFCEASRKQMPGIRSLHEKLLADTLPLIEQGESAEFSYPIRNVDRSIGAALSGSIAKRYGAAGIAAHPLRLSFSGTAGQSFGAWNAAGLELSLTGDANDYVGKGMAGGLIAIHPPEEVTTQWHHMAIAGNTCLYGATSGKLYLAGRVGERFAVRNSGAHAVVMGTGDHCCEYMTGGVVAVLGQCGINFGAGMTGGFAFVYDEHKDFHTRLNGELVVSCPLSIGKYGPFADFLHDMLEDYVDHTGSTRARSLLQDFSRSRGCFRLVVPPLSHGGLLEILEREASRSAPMETQRDELLARLV
jgi:glutamate synthase (NADPH/NADH) large chain